MTAHLQELKKLPEILQQMEDLKAAQLPQASPHGAIDRAGIRIDYTFALRHYTDSAASIYSDMNTPSAPSLQVSALETGSSQLTSRFYTAPMSQTSSGNICQSSRKCTQVLVRNVGLHKTMAFQVIPEHTIGTIKSLICERIGLENAEFELLYSSHVLDSPEKSIDEYGIPHDATLTCISFRPDHSPPNPIEPFIYMSIKTLDGNMFHLRFRPDILIREIKEMIADRHGHGLKADDIHLLYVKLDDLPMICSGVGNKVLEDDRCLLEYGINVKSRRTLFYIPRLRPLNVPPNTKSEKSLQDISAKTQAAASHHLETENTASKVPSFWKAPLNIYFVLRRRIAIKFPKRIVVTRTADEIQD